MMTSVIKRSLGLSIISCALIINSVSAEHRPGADVFKKWTKLQKTYSDVNFSNFKAELNDVFLLQFRNKYELYFEHLAKMTPFLQLLTSGQINEYGYQFKPPLDKAFADKMSALYDLFESNIPGFIDFLKQGNFSSIASNEEETKTHYDQVINKYKALVRLFVPGDGDFAEEQSLFALSNRLFEYCFESKTFGHYQELLGNVQYYSIARFLNAVIWYHLVGEGWKHWHQNCLDVLKDRFDKGQEIVYVAGGTDVYQLLRAGIYKIRVIDPFYPTQERYYTKNYLWLIRSDAVDGGIGDEVALLFEKRNIFLKREAFKETEDKFFVKLSNNKVIELKKSYTTWNVYDAKKNQIGSIVFERRLVEQADFSDLSSKAIVYSYDEAVSSVVPELLNGWGIDPSKFPDDIQIFVKQLRKSVTKDMLCNMRIVSMINLADLKFINLASDPT